MNSSGNICIMNYKEGDIISDFGYTKGFIKWEKKIAEHGDILRI